MARLDVVRQGDVLNLNTVARISVSLLHYSPIQSGTYSWVSHFPKSLTSWSSLEMSFGYSQALGGESAPPDHTRARGVHALVALGEELHAVAGGLLARGALLGHRRGDGVGVDDLRGEVSGVWVRRTRRDDAPCPARKDTRGLFRGRRRRGSTSGTSWAFWRPFCSSWTRHRAGSGARNCRRSVQERF